jgi:hypothetical protein
MQEQAKIMTQDAELVVPAHVRERSADKISFSYVDQDLSAECGAHWGTGQVVPLRPPRGLDSENAPQVRSKIRELLNISQPTKSKAVTQKMHAANIIGLADSAMPETAFHRPGKHKQF